MEHENALIDREYLSEISGGDTEFEKELIQAFLEVAPDLIQTYMDAVEAQDAAKLTYAAHTLKGSSRSIGANMFATVTGKAEKAAREGDVDTCRDLAPAIAEQYLAFSVVGNELLNAA